MQQTLESLLIALLVALNPAEPDAPSFAPDEGSGGAGPAATAPPAPLTVDMDVDRCRNFNDPEARRNCIIRTTRPLSGSSEVGEFPSRTVWIAPNDPGMPFRFQLPDGQ